MLEAYQDDSLPSCEVIRLGRYVHGKNVLFEQSRYGFISTKTKNALMPYKICKNDSDKLYNV